MKFGISLLALLIGQPQSHATPIKIFYETDSSNAQLVKNIFIDSYQIPEDLISLKEVSLCSELKAKGKLDLCLNDNGDLLIVSVDSGFISESLKIFRTP